MHADTLQGKSCCTPENISTQHNNQGRIQDLQTGAEDDEALQMPRGWGVGRVCPSPHREGSRKGQCPLSRKKIDFGSQNGDFRCILGTIFRVELFGLNAMHAPPKNLP